MNGQRSDEDAEAMYPRYKPTDVVTAAIADRGLASQCSWSRRFMPQRFLVSNGSHQRPHADLSARGRAALTRAPSSAARGRALYVSRWNDPVSPDTVLT